MGQREVDELKEAIEAERRGRGRSGVAFDRDLRAQIVEQAQRRVQSGERVVGIAESLGIRSDTLRRWLKGREGPQRRKPSRFRRVRVVEARPRAKTEVTLWGPGGTRIEGLTLEQAAELLRRMA